METMKDADDITLLLNALKDPARRLHAIQELGRRRLDPAIAGRSLARVLADGDELVRQAAVEGLVRAGNAGAEGLIAALAAGDRQVRRRAAAALGQVRGEPHKAVPSLMRALKDPDANVRRLAARSLGLLGLAARPAVAALSAALQDTDRVGCRLAAWALIQIGQAGIAALEQALFSGDDHICCEAVWALGQAGSKARTAIPALVGLLGQGTEEARRPAPAEDKDSLSSTAVFVIAPFRQPKVEVRAGAIRALGQIGREAPEARFPLAAATQDRDPHIRALAFAALRNIDPDLNRQADGADTIECRYGWPRQVSSVHHLPPPRAESA
jgi:HEAT repeat protein